MYFKTNDLIKCYVSFAHTGFHSNISTSRGHANDDLSMHTWNILLNNKIKYLTFLQTMQSKSHLLISRWWYRFRWNLLIYFIVNFIKWTPLSTRILWTIGINIRTANQRKYSTMHSLIRSNRKLETRRHDSVSY